MIEVRRRIRPLLATTLLVALASGAGLVGPTAAGAVRPAARPATLPRPETAVPLNVANFVIIAPNGTFNTYSEPVTVTSPNGVNDATFLAGGYSFHFSDAARGLHPGTYSTLVDANFQFANDPNCSAVGQQVGTFRIDQAAYDASGTNTTFGVQFYFVCFDGLILYGTLAYQLLNTTPNQGYYLYDNSGDSEGFGNDNYLRYLGSPSFLPLAEPIVGMAPTADGNGYWMAARDGGVFAYGDAAFAGSMGGKPLNSPIVGTAATADGGGYWLVAADGGVFAFGDAVYAGSMGGKPLVSPIVGIAATPTGKGYWLVAADGGVFAFGDAVYAGSMGGKPLNSAIVGLAATPSGHGYWLVAADGGIFTFGDAAFAGSAANLHVVPPVTGMLATADGGGYLLTAADGGVFAYGDAVFAGTPSTAQVGLGFNPIGPPIGIVR